MVWLYVPDMEGLNWELSESFQSQEPFVMLKGKPSQPHTLLKKWKKGGWITRLSGLMLSPLMASLGVEKWILSLEDSHASPIQLLENKWGKQTKETSGPILSESLGKCDLDSYSLRTFQTSLTSDLTKLSLTSISWGIMLHGVLWRLPKLERPIEGKDGFSLGVWPTPTAMNGGQGIAPSHLKGKHGCSLGAPVKYQEMFPTPTSSDGIRTNETYGAGNLTLKGKVKSQEMFPTPRARESNEIGGSMERDGRLGREKETLTRMISGEEVLTHGGRLNPQWVAWLMGLPIGWINLDYWEMV